jgi:UDP-glucose 4-epimerase
MYFIRKIMRKKVVITGGTGLLGSHLVDDLLQQDEYDLYLISREATNIHRDPKIIIVQMDLSQNADIKKLPEAIFAVIHLAQSKKFRDFPGSAGEVFHVNTLSTMRLIDYAIKANASHFVYASTGGIYGADGIYNELEPINFRPNMGFYTGTKLCSEIILESYSKLLNLIVLRFFFIYGKGQNKNMLLPRLVGCVTQGNKINLEGTEGLKINPIHATDAAKAIIASLKLSGSFTINVAGEEVLSLKDISEIIGNELGVRPEFNFEDIKQSKSLIADTTEMLRLLITPSIKMKDGIKTLINHA